MILALVALLGAMQEPCTMLYSVRFWYEATPGVWQQVDPGPMEYDRALACERRDRIARDGFTFPCVLPACESEMVVPPGAFRRGPQVQAYCCWMDRPLPERRCEERQ